MQEKNEKPKVKKNRHDLWEDRTRACKYEIEHRDHLSIITEGQYFPVRIDLNEEYFSVLSVFSQNFGILGKYRETPKFRENTGKKL